MARENFDQMISLNNLKRPVQRTYQVYNLTIILCIFAYGSTEYLTMPGNCINLGETCGPQSRSLYWKVASVIPLIVLWIVLHIYPTMRVSKESAVLS